MRDLAPVGGPDRLETPNAAAVYIATLTDQLARMAEGQRLGCLRYILDMARLEAEQIAKYSADARR